jgi:hypothetical protein
VDGSDGVAVIPAAVIINVVATNALKVIASVHPTPITMLKNTSQRSRVSLMSWEPQLPRKLEVLLQMSPTTSH